MPNAKVPFESIQEATTDRNGQVYLLTQVSSNFWKIRSADSFDNENKAPKLLAAGDEIYVKREWNNLIERERDAIASNYLAHIQHSLQQHV